MKIGIDVQILEIGDRGCRDAWLCERTVRLLAADAAGHEIVLFGRGDAPPPELAPLPAGNLSYARIAADRVPSADPPRAPSAPFLWSTPKARNLDVYHVTAPLSPGVLLPEYSPCPVAATLPESAAFESCLHDTSLPAEGRETDFDRRIRTIRGYGRHLAITRSAADDWAARHGFSTRRIRVTGVPVDQRPLAGLSDAEAGEIVAALRLQPGYTLAESGSATLSELEFLLRAFARLPADLRRLHPLVFVGAPGGAGPVELKSLAAAAGVEGEIAVVDAVTARQRIALIRCAGCAVFPSLQAGFAVSAAETLLCGTPAVAPNAPASLEALGEAGILFDAGDEEALADAMRKLATDAELRRSHAALGYLHAEDAAPDRYVERLLKAYESARQGSEIESRPPSAAAGPERPRLAAFVPTSRRSAALPEFHEPLLAELARRAELDLFVGESADDSGISIADLPHYNAALFERRHAAAPYASILYFLTDTDRSLSLLPFAEHYPGVVFLTGDAGPEYRAALVAATSVLVQSDWSARQVRASAAPGAPLEIVFHGPLLNPAVAPPRIDPDSSRRLRRKWFLSADAFAIATIGEIVSSRRLQQALDAFATFRLTAPGSVFYLLGAADPDTLRRLNDFVAKAGLKHCVRFLGNRPAAQIRELIALADVCIDLKESGSPSSPSVVPDILAAGRPLIVSATDELAELPDSVCWKVRPEPEETTDLIAFLIALRENREAAAALGRNAREFMEMRTWAACADKVLAAALGTDTSPPG